MQQKDVVPYKGYQIRIMSFQLILSGKWEFKVIISRQGGIFSRDFLSPHTFKTEEEALQGCLEYGKGIVDGKIPGCSIDYI